MNNNFFCTSQPTDSKPETGKKSEKNSSLGFDQASGKILEIALTSLLISLITNSLLNCVSLFSTFFTKSSDFFSTFLITVFLLLFILSKFSTLASVAMFSKELIVFSKFSKLALCVSLERVLR